MKLVAYQYYIIKKKQFSWNYLIGTAEKISAPKEIHKIYELNRVKSELPTIQFPFIIQPAHRRRFFD